MHSMGLNTCVLVYQPDYLLQDTCNDLQSRLKRFEKGMEDEGPVSNDPRILRRQSLETEVNYKDHQRMINGQAN